MLNDKNTVDLKIISNATLAAATLCLDLDRDRRLNDVINICGSVGM